MHEMITRYHMDKNAISSVSEQSIHMKGTAMLYSLMKDCIYSV